MIRQVCLYLTRHCNLACRYCRIFDNSKQNELTTEEVKTALEIIRTDVKPEFVVFFGGEPFLRPDIQEIIDEANDLGLAYTVITNGTVKKDVRNLKGVTCSVDGVDPGTPRHHDGVKSVAGLARLRKWKEEGVPDVVGNMIIHAENHREVRHVVRTLSSEGIWSVVGVVHSGEGWSFRSHCPELKLNSKQAMDVACWLQELKREPGILLHNIDRYFEMLPFHGASLDWKCENVGKSLYLTIDSDGGLLACNDRFGVKTPNMSIFDWNEKEYQEAWLEDVTGCEGCFYNHMIQVSYGEPGKGLVHE